MSDPSDEELAGWLRGMRGGDSAARERAFEYVWLRFEVVARRLKARYPALASYEQPSDLFQGALLKLLKKYRDHPDQIPDDPALLRIQVAGSLHDVCVELVRKYLGPHAPARVHARPEVADRVKDETSVSGRLVREEENAMALLAVDELPTGPREAVRLRYSGEGMPYREIAETFGVDVSTVKRWVRGALRDLRGRLERP